MVVCCLQKLPDSMPPALSAQSALARIMAVCGRSQPRTGDQRSAEGTPAASPSGSNTPTGPSAARAVIVTERLYCSRCRGDHRSRGIQEHGDHDVVALATPRWPEHDHRVLNRRPALHPMRRSQRVADVSRDWTKQRRSQGRRTRQQG